MKNAIANLRTVGPMTNTGVRERLISPPTNRLADLINACIESADGHPFRAR